mgnify:CR=1 FL=1
MQIYGSGVAGYQNTALVNSSGRLLVSAEISGNIIIGSVSASVDSIYIQSGNNIHLGSAWENIGSVLISNPSVIGSIGIQNISGVLTIDNRVAGSIVNLPIGSNFTLSSPGSIGVFITTGSVNQTTDPWRITGSISQFGVGSVRIAEQGIIPLNITGSITPYGIGSIRVSEWGIVGSIVGSVYQLTSPWTISGTSTVAGSVFTTGSINISNFNALGSNVIVSNFGDLGSQRTIAGGSINIYGQSGTSWLPIGVESGTNAILRTTTIGSVVITTNPLPISGIVNIGLGSVRVLNASFGSEVFMPAGSVIITNIQSPTGSIEVYQTTNSDMQVQATQETSPWVVSGTATISGNISIEGGSIRLLTTTGSIGIYAGLNTIFGISGNVIGISGIVNQGTIPWSISGTVRADILTSPVSVSGIMNLGSNWGGVGSIYQVASMRTYPSFDIIRKASGSPAVNYVFGGISRGVLIENLGSAIVYFNFDSTANPANSGTGLLEANDIISLNIEVGSVSIQSSGLTSSDVQVIGLR